ncbi:secreted protein [Desulfitobacterium sp. LBE]|uniref:FAD-binding protein n=1 Tax=Desulfitobacterium sp. LBE TaxID=884086 RepID=UPI00119BEE66|nr:FAD-binding protein [Desulfitobacterium sp. LBE]TWH56905.1 secreted protein [Desulfitobacterium sp. LBE]
MENNQNGISRRSFLRGAAAGTAGVAIAGMLGACASTQTAAPAFTGVPETWDKEADVVVVGSGTALTGALKAQSQGMSVLVLEALGLVGGTTALSGGAVWIPCNSYAQDSKEAARIYMTKVADGLSTPEIIDAYIEHGSEMIDFLTETAGIKWALADRTDYHVQWEGGTRKVRTLKPLDENGQLSSLGAGYTKPEADTLVKLGGEIMVKTTAERLIARPLADGRQEVIGVVANSEGKTLNIKAKKAVLLGAGGFDYNDEMKARYLPIPSPCSFAVSSSDGKGILMAQAVGADLHLMPYGWGQVAYSVIGKQAYEKRVIDINICPLCYQNDSSSMWINRHGRRFCDEASDYDSFWYGFGGGRDTTGDMAYTNIPAWYVCDQGNRDRIGAGGAGAVATPDAPGKLWGVEPDAEPPEWVYKADTLEELAAKIGINAENFVEQVARFNKYAAEGKDPEFHRGESLFDQGGPGRPADCLEPMNKPPYYAAEIVPFVQGTKGGPRTNEKGQVMHVNGDIVPRLYACGNMAGMGGPGKYYPGAGGTVGPGMVFSYLAAVDMTNLESWE